MAFSSRGASGVIEVPSACCISSLMMSVREAICSCGCMGRSLRSSFLTTARIVSHRASAGIHCLAWISRAFSIVLSSVTNSVTVLGGLRTIPQNSSSFTPCIKERNFFHHARVSTSEKPLHLFDEHNNAFIRVLCPRLQQDFGPLLAQK